MYTKCGACGPLRCMQGKNTLISHRFLLENDNTLILSGSPGDDRQYLEKHSSQCRVHKNTRLTQKFVTFIWSHVHCAGYLVHGLGKKLVHCTSTWTVMNSHSALYRANILQELEGIKNRPYHGSLIQKRQIFWEWFYMRINTGFSTSSVHHILDIHRFVVGLGDSLSYIQIVSGCDLW